MFVFYMIAPVQGPGDPEGEGGVPRLPVAGEEPRQARPQDRRGPGHLHPSAEDEVDVLATLHLHLGISK